MTTVNIKCNEEEHQHKFGQYYLLEDNLCILSQVDSATIALISLSSGNRWSDPIKVQSERADIVSREEFLQCIGSVLEESVVHVKGVNISYEM